MAKAVTAGMGRRGEEFGSGDDVRLKCGRRRLAALTGRIRAVRLPELLAEERASCSDIHKEPTTSISGNSAWPLSEQDRCPDTRLLCGDPSGKP